jgi:hypothetical protein
LETRIGILGAMMTRSGLAFSLLLTCAVLACSGSKSEGDNPSHADSSAADGSRLDGQGADARKPDGLASDGQLQDTPTAQLPDAQVSSPDAPAPTPDGQAPNPDAPVPNPDAPVAIPDGKVPDVSTDRSITESGTPGLDVGLASDATDAGARDTRQSDDAALVSTDGPVSTDGGVDSAEVGSAPSPDAPVDVAQCGRINCDCTYKGKKLWGKVEYVTVFPDFKVKVSSFPDLNVKETMFATQCGEWERVTAFGDFKVQIVDMFEDFDIAYSYFPGIP